MDDEPINKTIDELDPHETLNENDLLPIWDSVNLETKKVTMQTLKNQIGAGGVGGLAFSGTRAEYNVAKLIPEGQEGFIPAGAFVDITDENDYVKAEEHTNE